jgi:hypothetical protein
MKNLFTLVLALAFAAFTSSAMADDSTTTIYLSQSGDNAAKVCTAHPLGYDGSKCLGTVPIKFADGTSWNDVKRSYDVSAAEVSALSSKCASITVQSDGGISVATTKCSSKAAAKK